MSNWLWGFQSPILLFAAISIIIPIAIHLFSKSKGRRIAFGSLKFIKQTKPVKMTQIRLVEPLLLLLRVLLLLISVVFLAQLYLVNPLGSATNKVAFVTADWLNNASPALKQQLLSQEESIYLLTRVRKEQAKSQQLAANEILNWQNIDDKSSIMPINLWALVAEKLRVYPESVEVSIYSTTGLSQFYGEKVSIANNVQWHLLDRTANEVNKQTRSLNLHIIKNTTTATAIAQNNALKIETALNLISRQHPEISVISVDHKQRNVDEKTPSWIIYLSDKALSENIIAQVSRGANLLVVDNVALDERFYRSNELSAVFASFYQQNLVELDYFQVKKLGMGKVYALASNEKKQQMWHVLTQQHDFAQMLLSLLLERQTHDFFVENFRLTQQQIMASTHSEAVSRVNDDNLPTVQQNPQSPLTLMLFIFMLVIWAMERLISELSSKSKRLMPREVNE